MKSQIDKLNVTYRNLKVKTPEKYFWDPKWLLSNLIDIYLHLDSDKLANAIANDQVTKPVHTTC